MEQREDFPGECHGRQAVHRQAEFVPVRGSLSLGSLGVEADARVVDEDVQPVVYGGDVGGESPDLGE